MNINCVWFCNYYVALLKALHQVAPSQHSFPLFRVSGETSTQQLLKYTFVKAFLCIRKHPVSMLL